MEWLNDNLLTLMIAIAVIGVAWFMGRSDGTEDATKLDGQVRHCDDGWLWIRNNGEWKQVQWSVTWAEDPTRYVRISDMDCKFEPFTAQEIEKYNIKRIQQQRLLNE